MGSKSLTILLALFWALWTGIIIPGHTRGCVPLTTTSGSAAPAACPFCMSGNGEAPGKKGADPARKDSGNCAICNFVAKLSTGVTYHFDPKPGELLGVERVAVAVPALRRVALRTFNSRAPPVIAGG